MEEVGSYLPAEHYHTGFLEQTFVVLYFPALVTFSVVLPVLKLRDAVEGEFLLIFGNLCGKEQLKYTVGIGFLRIQYKVEKDFYKVKGFTP